MFKQRKNKRFNYKPRFSNEEEINLDSEDVSKSGAFISKWQESRGSNKRKVKGGMSIRVLIIILVLLLICMFYLDSKIN